MSWSVVSLGDICQFKYGKSLPASARDGGKFAVYGSNGRVGNHSLSITKGSTIVIGRKGSYGELNYSEGPCWPIDTTYFVDQTCTSADLRWLFHVMGSLHLTELNRAAAIPGLNRNDAYVKLLNLPPLPEQRRIAAILDKADALRAQHRAAIAKLDELLQSVFIEMFGDPVTNPRGWPETTSLGEVADIVSGITKGRKTTATTREVAYMAVSNVQDRFLKLDVVKLIEATDDEIEKYRLQRDDLLLTEGGDPDKLGRGVLWSNEIAECIHQNHVFRVRLNSDQLHPLYLNWYVGSERGKRYFLGQAKQTTGIASINMRQLRGLPLLMPPLHLQQRFARIAEKIEFQKQAVQRAIEKSETLFVSLQQLAFSGKL